MNKPLPKIKPTRERIERVLKANAIEQHRLRSRLAEVLHEEQVLLAQLDKEDSK